MIRRGEAAARWRVPNMRLQVSSGVLSLGRMAVPLRKGRPFLLRAGKKTLLHEMLAKQGDFREAEAHYAGSKVRNRYLSSRISLTRTFFGIELRV